MNKIIKCFAITIGLVFNLPFAIAQVSNHNNTEYKQEYIDAYDFANNDDFVAAITAMMKISAESPYYELAQKKISEWKELLVSRGSSYETELEKLEFTKASSYVKKGYLVLAIYHLKNINEKSAYYNDAQREIQRLEERLREMNLSYESAFAKYRKEYDLAITLSQNKEYEKATQALSDISQGSPFYNEAQEQLKKTQRQLEADGAVHQVSNKKQSPLNPRHFEFTLQGQFSGSDLEQLTPGGGFGFSYFINPNLAIHSAPSAYFSEYFIVGFIPLSVRYYFDLGQVTPFIGAGGFVSVLNDEEENLQVPLGILGEFGIDYRLNDNWALGLEANYGQTIMPDSSHTFGFNTGVKYAF